MIHVRLIAWKSVVLCVLAATGMAALADSSSVSGEPLTAAQAAAAFQDALAAGDADAARALLADDVLIYEGGGVERSAEEYASHHLQADIDFLSQMRSENLESRVSVVGDVAVSTSRSRLRGTVNDQDLDLLSDATLVLRRVDGQWLIVHIHWSSGPA